MAELKIVNKKYIKVDTPEDIHIILIGVGGSGARIAYDLVQISSLNKNKNIKITFVDGDYVEDKNLNRQKFTDRDINKNKAECTARRCIGAYHFDVEVLDKYIESEEELRDLIEFGYFPIIIGASDSLALRKLVCDTIDNYLTDCVYIDGGNDKETGQVIFTYMKDGNYITPNFFMEFPSAVEDLKTAKLVTHMSCDELMNSAPQTIRANKDSENSMFSFLDMVLNEESIGHYLINFDSKRGTRTSKPIPAN